MTDNDWEPQPTDFQPPADQINPPPAPESAIGVPTPNVAPTGGSPVGGRMDMPTKVGEMVSATEAGIIPEGSPPEGPGPISAPAEDKKIDSEYKGLPVRVRGVGDKIFLLLKGKKHWVSTAEAYSSLGFKFGDEVEIDVETATVFVEGEVIK